LGDRDIASFDHRAVRQIIPLVGEGRCVIVLAREPVLCVVGACADFCGHVHAVELVFAALARNKERAIAGATQLTSCSDYQTSLLASVHHMYLIASLVISI